MKRIRLEILLCLFIFACGSPGAASGVPKTGGIAFRFDDNQAPEKWRAMGALFEEYGFRMSVAVNFGRLNPGDQTSAGLLRHLQQAGHEVMDHTPDHAVFRMRLNDRAAGELETHPAVDHRTGDILYFKYRVKTDRLGTPFRARVDGSQITVPAEVRAELEKEWIIYCPELETAFMTVKTETGHELRSFWDEKNIDLGSREELEFRIAPRFRAFAVVPEALELMAEFTQRRAKELQLAPPVSWIQPGSREPVILAGEVRAVFGEEFGYVSGATYQDAAFKVYNEPEPERCRFAMQWGDFNLEKQTADQAKKIIADRVAKNHVLIGGGHMWVHQMDGGMKEYLERHRELLRWCRETGIAVKTQSQWAKLLYCSAADPAYNIMPKLSVDRDGDGRPDGFILGEGVTVTGDRLISNAPGRIFRINQLAGMEKGENRFRFTVENGRGEELKLLLDLVTPQRPSTRIVLPIKLNNDAIQVAAITVAIPEDTVFMHLDLVRGGGADGPLKIRDLSFARCD